MNVILESLQEKYRVIRERFKKNFIAIGKGPGMSIPYSIRNNELFWFNYHYSGYYKDVIDTSRSKYKTWTEQQNHFYGETGATWGAVACTSDATVGIGFYLGMLATEYALLEKNATTNIADKRALADEIYYALEAVKRLDKKAFEVLGYQSDGYGGYFLRDDLDIDFYKSVPDTTQMLGRKIGAINSDFISPKMKNNFEDYVNSKSAFMSQDQAFFLFMGFALLKKYLPNTLKSQHSTEPLIDIVKKIARGIVERYRDCGWVVTAPNGTKNMIGGNTGGAGYAYPLALAGKYIFGELLMDTAMIALHRSWWSIAGQISGVTSNNLKMVEVLRALSNYPLNTHSPASSIDPLILADPHVLMSKLFFINGIGDSIDRNTDSKNLRSIFPLIQILLHSCPLNSDKKQKLKDHLTKILIDCPYFPCKEGNGQHIPYTKSVDGWKSGNRWVHNGVIELRKDKDNDQSTLHNGIDYMIAYNLYHLYFYENEPYSISKKASDPDIHMKFSIRKDCSVSATILNGLFNTSSLLKLPKDYFHYCSRQDGIFYRGHDDILYFLKYEEFVVSGKTEQKWTVNPVIPNYKLKCKAVFYATERGKIYYVGLDSKWYNFFLSNDNWYANTLNKDVNNATEDAVFDYARGSIYYRGTDNTLNRLKWEPLGWIHTLIRGDVKTVTGELILGPGKVYYKNNEGRLFQMMTYNGSWHSWPTNNGGAKIKDNLIYLDLPYNLFIYRGEDDYLHTIFFYQQKWDYKKLPYGNVYGQIKHAKNNNRIFYLEQDRKIAVIYKIGNNWHYEKLADGPRINNDFYISSNGNEVFFIGEDKRLYKHILSGSWTCRLVSQSETDFESIISLDKTEERLYTYTGKITFQY